MNLRESRKIAIVFLPETRSCGSGNGTATFRLERMQASLLRIPGLPVEHDRAARVRHNHCYSTAGTRTAGLPSIVNDGHSRLRTINHDTAPRLTNPHFSRDRRPDRANPMPAGTSVAISDTVGSQAVTISRAGLRCSGN